MPYPTAALPPTRIGKAVPFFAVADMQASLRRYTGGLGFRMARSWAPDGQVRWCWLELGSAALMLQQFPTDGADARLFEGRRGAGAAFAVVSDRSVDLPSLLHAANLADDDGYVLRDPHTVLKPGRGAATTIPVLDVSNLERSVAFYRDILGYSEAGAAAQACRLQRDDADVVLRQETSPPERRGQGVSIFHMCHDAIAYYREVTARGGSMTEPRVGNRLWETEIRDPDGWNLAYESPTDVEEETLLSEVEATGDHQAGESELCRQLPRNDASSRVAFFVLESGPRKRTGPTVLLGSALKPFGN